MIIVPNRRSVLVCLFHCLIAGLSWHVNLWILGGVHRRLHKSLSQTASGCTIQKTGDAIVLLEKRIDLRERTNRGHRWLSYSHG